MKKIVMTFLVVMLLFTACGKGDVPNTEGNTQQSDSTEEGTEATTEAVTETESESEEELYTYTELEAVMYASAAVNVRALPSTEGEKLGGLSLGQEVSVTGQCQETNWYRIKYEGKTAYVSNEYLVKELPSSWVKDLDAAKTTTQMIVVAGNGTNATVSMHTKNENGVWVENFSVGGRLGYNGLGKQREGDGKTPIGVYRFMSAFGTKENPGLSVLPYLLVDETHHWVDDPNSKFYNKCVSTRDVEPDWASSEHLYKCVPSYHYALALNYNEACTPWVGCAIFLHCPNDTFGPTAGCIAIPEANMIQAMKLLRSDCVIIIDYEANIMNY